MDIPDEQVQESLTIEGAGSVVRDLRESMGKSVAEFSASLGVPESTFKGIEDNEVPLSMKFMLEIAKAAKVMPEELIVSCLKAAHPKLENSKIGRLLDEITEAIRAIPDEEENRPTACTVEGEQVVGVSADAAIQAQPYGQENQEHTGSEGVAEDTES